MTIETIKWQKEASRIIFMPPRVFFRQFLGQKGLLGPSDDPTLTLKWRACQKTGSQNRKLWNFLKIIKLFACIEQSNTWTLHMNIPHEHYTLYGHWCMICRVIDVRYVCPLMYVIYVIRSCQQFLVFARIRLF